MLFIKRLYFFKSKHCIHEWLQEKKRLKEKKALIFNVAVKIKNKRNLLGMTQKHRQ